MWPALLLLACHRPSPETGDTGSPITAFTLSVDDEVRTMVRAAWPDDGATEAWVEYRFDGGDWLVAPRVDATSAVLLGLPPATDVEARLVSIVGGETVTSAPADVTTGSLPSSVIAPTVSVANLDLADPAPWLMISVATGGWTFEGPYYVVIVDRQGRVVWYDEVPQELMSFYPSVARDGTHIWYDAADVFGMSAAESSVHRRTLDGRWATRLAVPNMGQAIAEGPDGAFFFEHRTSAEKQLRRLAADGTTTTEWDCAAHFDTIGVSARGCDMNACNWDEARDTVLVSQFVTDTVFEIDLATGEPVRQMGQLDEGAPYTFDPPESMFAYQHDPHWTADGTLLVSTHIDGVNGTQVAAEYVVDDATRTLTRVWAYTSTDAWATQLGEARRLPNGNTLVGYGQDGALREVTPDGTVVWHAEWPRDDYGYRVVGHASAIDDLYALNRGPE